MTSETKPCPHCGKPILSRAKRCIHCGIWFKENKTFLGVVLDVLMKILMAPIYLIIGIISFMRGFGG